MKRLKDLNDDEIEMFIRHWEAILKATGSVAVENHCIDQIDSLREELGIRHSYDQVDEDLVHVFEKVVGTYGESEAVVMVEVVNGSKWLGRALIRAYTGAGRKG